MGVHLSRLGEYLWPSSSASSSPRSTPPPSPVRAPLGPIAPPSRPAHYSEGSSSPHINFTPVSTNNGRPVLQGIHSGRDFSNDPENQQLISDIRQQPWLDRISCCCAIDHTNTAFLGHHIIMIAMKNGVSINQSIKDVYRLEISFPGRQIIATSNTLFSLNKDTFSYSIQGQVVTSHAFHKQLDRLPPLLRSLIFKRESYYFQRSKIIETTGRNQKRMLIVTVNGDLN